MGAGQSKLDDDFEGKYFTTGDGIKLSSQVLQRLSDEPENNTAISDTVEELKLKDMERELAMKQLLSEKLQEMEESQLNQKLEMERQREKIMTDYDLMINSREKQIHELIADLDTERTKYMDAVKDRDEKISQVCDSWTGKLQVKECEFQQLQDRLAEKENELNDVTTNMNSQIQQEKDKLVEVTEGLTQQIKNEQDKLARISQTAHEEFEAAAKRVDQKFRPSGFESVCRPAQNNLVDCYNDNPGKPLACYKQLNDFKKCVADTKMKLFEKEKAAKTEEL